MGCSRRWKFENFSRVLNNKLRKSRIHGLLINGTWETSTQLIKSHIFEVFKSKFELGLINRPTFSSSLFKTLSCKDVSLLDLLFSHEEVKATVWDCGGDKSPGPDGFTFKFIKKNWETLGGDIISYVLEFEKKLIFQRVAIRLSLLFYQMLVTHFLVRKIGLLVSLDVNIKSSLKFLHLYFPKRFTRWLVKFKRHT